LTAHKLIGISLSIIKKIDITKKEKW